MRTGSQVNDEYPRAIPELRTAVVMPVATQRGGAEMTLLHALRHGTGVRWLAVFLEDGPLVRVADGLGADTAVVRVGRVRQVGELVRATRRLGGLLRRWRPQVAVSWMPKAHLYMGPVAELLRVPALWFQHGLPSATDPIDRAVALLPARGVLAPSRTVADAQEAIWPHRPVHVAYPGVEVDGTVAPSPRQVLETLGIGADAPVVGLVARLQRWKGVHVLIEALPSLLRSHPDAHVVVVGGEHPLEPGYRHELVAIAARLGVAERVHLVGYQPDAMRWMQAFDVVVHASDNEPFGLVVLEAMTLGKPLIAGARGGPAEIVRDGVDGFLVPYGDAATMADRIGRCLGDRALAERLGRAATESAARYSTARFADEVLRVLRTEARTR